MKEIAAAFLKAQKAFGPVLKDKNNPGFKNSKYATLEACIDAVIDSLNSNGIALVQQTHPDDSGVIVETIFIHESGETLSSGKLHIPAPKQDPHGFGSALTYARRYSLMAACGIAPEDDDGNAAVESQFKAALAAVNSAKSIDDLIAAREKWLGRLVGTDLQKFIDAGKEKKNEILGTPKEGATA